MLYNAVRLNWDICVGIGNPSLGASEIDLYFVVSNVHKPYSRQEVVQPNEEPTQLLQTEK